MEPSVLARMMICPNSCWAEQPTCARTAYVNSWPLDRLAADLTSGVNRILRLYRLDDFGT